MKFSELPALGDPLDSGIFAGITTSKDGTHYAVVLLPEVGKKLTWKKALTWATEQQAELPTRTIASLLFANLKDKLNPTWHWTNEEYDDSYVWHCGFGYGGQHYDLKSYEGSAVAVRLLPIEKGQP